MDDTFSASRLPIHSRTAKVDKGKEHVDNDNTILRQVLQCNGTGKQQAQAIGSITVSNLANRAYVREYLDLEGWEKNNRELNGIAEAVKSSKCVLVIHVGYHVGCLQY